MERGDGFKPGQWAGLSTGGGAKRKISVKGDKLVMLTLSLDLFRSGRGLRRLLKVGGALNRLFFKEGSKFEETNRSGRGFKKIFFRSGRVLRRLVEMWEGL